ncbi:MAG: D-aminoacyl-tRNA deacylase, partial [Candidatus Competibacterales bacterium]|nr:D-aminoacyl-tRNA deacylase [Candidatus Competibacterales bacterium]
MKALIQRVSQASVDIDNRRVAEIGPGLLALIGVAPTDDMAVQDKLLRKMLDCRIFPDSQGRMNLSLGDIEGGLLLVPNFTLMANTRKGTRPSFASAATPAQARQRFESLCDQAREQCVRFGCGEFGADMQVGLINDGPVTFWLQVR